MVQTITSHHDYRLIVQAVRITCVRGVGGGGEHRSKNSSGATTETEDQVKGGLLLDVVVAQSASILQLLASEDESLLIGWDSLLILDLGLHVVNGVRRLHLQRNRLSGESLDEDLHATTETKDQMKSGLFLDVVIRESTSILELLSGENQALLIRGDSLLVLDFRLDVVDGIRGLDLKGDGLASKGLDENLHTTTKTKD